MRQEDQHQDECLSVSAAEENAHHALHCGYDIDQTDSWPTREFVDQPARLTRIKKRRGGGAYVVGGFVMAVYAAVSGSSFHGIQAKAVMDTPRVHTKNRMKIHNVRSLQQDSNLNVVDYDYYDKLRLSNVNQTSRIGTVDVISNNPQFPNFAPQTLGLCHLVALWRYSSLKRHPLTGENIIETTGLDDYDDSASALLAVHHFNNGIGDVVDELHNINLKCNIRFTTEFLDTFSSKPKSVERIIQVNQRQGLGKDSFEGPPRPSVILGAHRSAVSAAVAVITGVNDIPQVSSASSSPDLDNQDLYPLFSRTIPSDAETSVLAVQRLIQLNVTHVAFLHVKDAYGNAYQRAFRAVAETAGMTVRAFSFAFGSTQEEIREAVQRVAETGYNYVFCTIFGADHYDMVMTEAFALGIAGNPNRVTSWMFSDGIERYLRRVAYPEGSPLALATRGVGVIMADSAVEGMVGYDRFLKVWREQKDEDVAFFNSKQPKGPLYHQVNSTHFQYTKPSQKTLLAYDVVAALGLAACQAVKSANTTSTTSFFDGPTHFHHMMQADFQGASGQVRFDPKTTSRDPKSVSYVLHNAIPFSPNEEGKVAFQLIPAAVRLPSQSRATESSSNEMRWTTLENRKFIFADGTANPPATLHPYNKDMQYIGKPLRAIGLFFSAITVLLSLVFALWTHFCRHDRIIRASQPIFLILICAGTAFMGSAIIPLSLDDEVLSQRGASMACMAVPWLFSVGYVLSFTALFSKTWRINKIFLENRLRRMQVTPQDVMAPLFLLLTLNVATLSIWTVLSPLQWVRVDLSSLDSFGRPTISAGLCRSGGKGSIPYIAVLMGVDASALLFACLQAYRARRISTEFSESRYVGMAMASILQACFLGLPLIGVVYGQPRPMYFVSTLLIFVVSMSVLLLIFVPKFRSLLEKKPETTDTRSSIAASAVLSSRPSASNISASLEHGGVLVRGSKRGNEVFSVGQRKESRNGNWNESGAIHFTLDEEHDVTESREDDNERKHESSPDGAAIREGENDTSVDDSSSEGLIVEIDPLIPKNKELRQELQIRELERRALIRAISGMMTDATENGTPSTERQTGSRRRPRCTQSTPLVTVTVAEAKELLHLASGEENEIRLRKRASSKRLASLGSKRERLLSWRESRSLGTLTQASLASIRNVLNRNGTAQHSSAQNSPGRPLEATRDSNSDLSSRGKRGVL